jgi:excinuclease ABC subunit C
MVCHDAVDRDVFACCREASRMAVTILFVRGGRINGTRDVILRTSAADEQEALASFVSQYYQQHPFIPDEVLLPFAGEDNDLLEQWLRGLKAGAVRVHFPRRGAKKDLLAMAAQNAAVALQKKQQEDGSALEELQARLHLRHNPFRIACCDISNNQGKDAVGSIVVFEDGKPHKKNYRTFRIKSVHRADDYAMMYEVLQRYLNRLKTDELPPDLILVDGGRGQLAILLRVLRETGSDTIDAAALAKGPERDRAKRNQTEKVFIPNRKNQVNFPHNSPALFLLQRVRDEAHRFAVRFHHRVKHNKDFSSELLAIPGIGPKTARALLKHFGSLKRIKKATYEQIAEVPAMSAKRAGSLHEALHQSASSQPNES